jgi:hypothetical protein
MDLLTLFENCTHGAWSNTRDFVTYKIVDRVIYFQCSKEDLDWWRNFFVVPTNLHIAGRKLATPAGFASAWKSIRGSLDWANIDFAVGYSHGAVLAAYVSVLKNCQAVLFGCPRFILNGRKLFKNCLVVKNPGDIVTLLPPIYRLPEEVHTLSGDIESGSIKLMLLATGHSPAEYRQRLENE